MTSVARFRAPTSVAATQRALWLEQAAAPSDDGSRTPLPKRCDVCVVGGGFAGLWTALSIKRSEPSAEVLLLEAGSCGDGASGRNGGFVMTAWSKFGTLQKHCGRQDALHYARSAEQAVFDIGDFCRAHQLDAQFHQGGWLWTATNRSQIDAWSFTIDKLAEVGEHPFQLLDVDEVAARSGSPTHLAGVFEASPAIVHPGLLARGLTSLARELGVGVIERCAVRELRSEPAPVVSTDRGEVRADRVALTISAWATAVPEVRRSVVVVASDVVATDPIPDRLEDIGWASGLAISDSRRLVNYYRTTDDGRVVFGKGGGALALGARLGSSFNRSPENAEEVRAQFQRIYPMLSDVRIGRHWRGAVDYSATGLPFVGPLAAHPEILVAVGFSGNGVGPSYIAGSALAQIALEREVERVPESLRRPLGAHMPPEPVRYLAGRIVRESVRRKEDAEDLGRSPGRLLRAVAALDPTSFTDRGSGAGASVQAAQPTTAVANSDPRELKRSA
ncbi:MAG: NAD(P)/FAD-dependent oxidoreductase [Solirubrobacteraceae bacterium]